MSGSLGDTPLTLVAKPHARRPRPVSPTSSHATNPAHSRQPQCVSWVLQHAKLVPASQPLRWWLQLPGAFFLVTIATASSFVTQNSVQRHLLRNAFLNPAGCSSRPHPSPSNDLLILCGFFSGCYSFLGHLHVPDLSGPLSVKRQLRGRGWPTTAHGPDRPVCVVTLPLSLAAFVLPGQS